MHTFTVNREDDGRYLYVVGFWTPPAYGEATRWTPLRDCASATEAARWVSYLNGGEYPMNARGMREEF